MTSSSKNTPSRESGARVFIFDTTLRDGEQSPGCSMTLEEKLTVARTLEDLKVDIIEAGFPIASPGDFEATKAIAQAIRGVTIAGLARAQDQDIDRAGEALGDAERPRIHTFIATSPLHRKYKLDMSTDQVLQAIDRSVRRARSYVEDVEWSAEDGSRTEIDFLCRCVETAIKAGASTINIPDTVGYAVPEEYGEIFRILRERVPGCDEIILSTHCHNDLGLAVSNSLVALQAGARQVECTINGIGERAGNTSLEEVVMALRTRADRYDVHTGVVAEKIVPASRTLSRITGFSVQPNKAIVGANAFAHEAGIHQDGYLKHAATYEIMTPESVGWASAMLPLGKHSGRRGFANRLKVLSHGDLADEVFERLFVRFKELADKKKVIYDEDLEALLADEVGVQKDAVTFVDLVISSGTNQTALAAVSLSIRGEKRTAMARSKGPVDAIFSAVSELMPNNAVLESYEVRAITGGTDAQATVIVRLSQDVHVIQGQGTDFDTMVASARAFVSALNRLHREIKMVSVKAVSGP
ncbi:MAG: 2-isopropylmalate synthase [Pseudomonadota bacterium]